MRGKTTRIMTIAEERNMNTNKKKIEKDKGREQPKQRIDELHGQCGLQLFELSFLVVLFRNAMPCRYTQEWQQQ